jgi:hypothetical protein
MPNTRSRQQQVEKSAMVEDRSFDCIGDAGKAELLIRNRMVVNPLGALKLFQKRPWFRPDSGTSRKLFFMGWQGRLTALFANGCPDVESSGYAFGTANAL